MITSRWHFNSKKSILGVTCFLSSYFQKRSYLYILILLVLRWIRFFQVQLWNVTGISVVQNHVVILSGQCHRELANVFNGIVELVLKWVVLIQFIAAIFIFFVQIWMRFVIIRLVQFAGSFHTRRIGTGVRFGNGTLLTRTIW